MKKRTIIIILIVTLALIILGVVSLNFLNKEKEPEKPLEYTGPLSGQINDDIERETKKEDIKEGTIVNKKEIKLDEYTDNITINKGGIYTLSGNFNNTIRIDTKENVELKLNNVNIKSQITSAIINLKENKLTINILENTENVIKDNGNSEYDACIYSYGEIIIKGAGKLDIKCNQLYSEGIATKDKNITINSGTINIDSPDDGINTGGEKGGVITINDGSIFIKADADAIDSNDTIVINNGTLYAIGGNTGNDGAFDSDNGLYINGGTVIALGYNQIEMPKEESKQYTLGLNLTELIDKDKIITLTNEYQIELISFKTENKINKILISHPYLNQGKYLLYSDNKHSGELKQGIYNNGEVTINKKISIKNQSEFEMLNIVTEINSTGRKPGGEQQ